MWKYGLLGTDQVDNNGAEDEADEEQQALEKEILIVRISFCNYHYILSFRLLLANNLLT